MVKKLFSIVLILFSFNFFFAQSSPVLSNFRIEDSHKDRVYFDSNKSITGSTITGFTISGKSITGVTINPGQLTGHYFTVSSAFTWWDNNTVRYEGNDSLGWIGTVGKSDIEDLEGNDLLDFSLTYIENNIVEPTASIYKYVSDNATGSGNGDSEDSPWTISQANNATPGTTVWIKAGNYTTTIRPRNAGTQSNPIKYIGYTSTINDNPNLNWSVSNKTLNSSIMPLITGIGGVSSAGIDINVRYLIFKNIMTTNNARGVYFKSSFIHVDNIISTEITTNSNAACFFANGDTNNNIRIINSVANNGGISVVRIYGRFNLVDNLKGINDTTSSDYAFDARGSNNIFRNIFLQRFSLASSGHGMVLKANGNITEYNLIEHVETSGIPRAIEARHNEVKYNVYRDFQIRGNPALIEDYPGGGVFIYNGASYNVFNRIIGKAWITFKATGEDPTAPTGGHNNILKNSVFHDSKRAIQFILDTDDQNRDTYDNTIINCTFYNIETFIYNATNYSSIDVYNNDIINCNIVNVKNKGFLSTSRESGVVFTNNNFYNNTNFTVPSGSFEFNPLFVNAQSGNFRLQPTSEVKDRGIDNNKVHFDADGVERKNGTYSIGAYDDATPTIGSVSPDADICNGESITLIASGGTSYSWNTGETTESITVSPSTTTTYTVTISDGANSNSHDVIVTVNTSPSVDTGSDHTICEGQSVTLTATGEGDFLWSTGETTASITVNPTTTTTYSVTASNSCSTDAIDEVVVTVNAGVTLDAGSDVSICQGESVTLTATGTGPFNWSTGETTANITVNPNSTTTYTVVSDNGNCSANDDVIVTVNTSPSVDAGSDQTICEGQSVTLTATGEGDFLWSTGETTASITVNPNTTTTYSVTATSQGCQSTAIDYVDVLVGELPNLSTTNDITIQKGESITLSATGNGTFEWSTGETTASITVSPLTTTDYTVTLTSEGGCSEKNTITVTVTKATDGGAVVAYAGEDVTICRGDEIVLTASGGDSYLWSNGAEERSITVSPSTSTVFSVKVTKNDNFDIAYVKVTIDGSCSLETTSEMIIYPNPARDILNLDILGYRDNINIQLYSLSGAMVHNEDLANDKGVNRIKHKINLSRLGIGVYFLILSNKGKIETRKIIHI